MVNLMKAGFDRVLKDRLFMVMCIIGGVFAAVNPMINKIFSQFDGLVAAQFSPMRTFSSALSIGTLYATVLGFLMIEILFKEFSQGTIRNQIIGGHSRSTVFAAIFAVSAIVQLGMVVLFAALRTAVAMLLLERSGETMAVGYALQSVGYHLLTLLFLAALTAWLWAVCRSMGTISLIYWMVALGTVLVLGLVAGIVAAANQQNLDSFWIKLLDGFMKYNPFCYTGEIGTGTSYTTREILRYVLTPVALSAVMLLHGFLCFRKRDLK